MLVRDVMTSPAITVAPRTSVKDGLRLLDRHRVTSLPVVGADGHLLGIVSEADLLKDAVRHKIERYELVDVFDQSRYAPSVRAAVEAYAEQTGTTWVTGPSPYRLE